MAIKEKSSSLIEEVGLHCDHSEDLKEIKEYMRKILNILDAKRPPSKSKRKL